MGMWRYVLLFWLEGSDMVHYLKNSQCNVLYRNEAVRSSNCHFNYKISKRQATAACCDY